MQLDIKKIGKNIQNLYFNEKIFLYIIFILILVLSTQFSQAFERFYTLNKELLVEKLEMIQK